MVQEVATVVVSYLQYRKIEIMPTLYTRLICFLAGAIAIPVSAIMVAALLQIAGWPETTWKSLASSFVKHARWLFDFFRKFALTRRTFKVLVAIPSYLRGTKVVDTESDVALHVRNVSYRYPRWYLRFPDC